MRSGTRFLVIIGSILFLLVPLATFLAFQAQGGREYLLGPVFAICAVDFFFGMFCGYHFAWYRSSGLRKWLGISLYLIAYMLVTLPMFEFRKIEFTSVAAAVGYWMGILVATERRTAMNEKTKSFDKPEKSP